MKCEDIVAYEHRNPQGMLNYRIYANTTVEKKQ